MRCGLGALYGQFLGCFRCQPGFLGLTLLFGLCALCCQFFGRFSRCAGFLGGLACGLRHIDGLHRTVLAQAGKEAERQRLGADQAALFIHASAYQVAVASELQYGALRQVVAPFAHDDAAVGAAEDALAASLTVLEVTRVAAAIGKAVDALAVEGAVFEFADVLVTIGHRVGALAMLFVVFEFTGIPVAVGPALFAHALVVVAHSRAGRQRQGHAAPGQQKNSVCESCHSGVLSGGAAPTLA